MRIANCKWFVGSRSLASLQVLPHILVHMAARCVMPDIFLLYEKQFSFNFTACGRKNEWKNVSYLNLSWFFQFQRLRWGRGNVCGSCVPWLSLSRCRFIERREKEEGTFWAASFPFPFAQCAYKFLWVLRLFCCCCCCWWVQFASLPSLSPFPFLSVLLAIPIHSSILWFFTFFPSAFSL